MENKYVVYKITNTFNGKMYIGMSNNLKTRWSGKGRQYKPSKGSTTARPFYNAIQKYGWDSFKKEILFEGLSKEEAWELEILKIEEFQTTDKDKGYNIAPGGNGGKVYQVHPKGMLGKHHTNENNIRQSEFMRNNNPMKEVVWGETHEHPKGMLGKKHTEEKKNQVSETLKKKGHAKKKVIVLFPDNETKYFNSINDCASYFNVSPTSSFLRGLLKSGRPYIASPQIKGDRLKKFKALEGIVIKYS
ncbi:hypothetical protein vBSauCG_140 [Staphylococcus phage vB_Sau_CG]|nr:hypothetical protein vBSauCG_140 [Staphylococcus phage vB_Sau_CG]